MKYTLQSIKYTVKNFLYIIPFALLPALCFAFSLDAEAIGEISRNYFTGHPGDSSFTDIFRAVALFNFRSGWAFLAGLLGFVLTVLCASLIFAMVEKHMRIGKRTWTGVFSRINDNLLSTLGICALYALIYEVWVLIASALIYLMLRFSALAVAYVFSALVYLGMHFVLLYAVSVFYLWLPCLQITGFRSFEALRYSYQLVSPVKAKIIFGQFLGILIAEAALTAYALFVPNPVGFLVIATLLLTWMLGLFCVRMQVVYFDRAGLDRADLQRRYY